MNKPICYGISSYHSNSMLSSNPHSGIYEATTTRTLDLNGGNPACNQGGIMVVEPMILDMTHAKDVLRISEDGTVPTLQHRMGTGGNQVPLVFESHPMDCRIKELDVVGPTVTRKYAKGTADTPLVVEREESDYMGNSYSLDEKMGQTYVWEEQANTLAARDYKQPQNVCCKNTESVKTYQKTTGPLMANSHPGSYTGQDAYSDMLVTDVEYVDTTHADDVVRTDSKAAALQARDYKGGKLVHVDYVVRRLTPVECARLQGFPDWWGELTEIEDMSDEDYEFWKEVLKTHAEVNGKTYREKTKKQMIAWYNKLHTDSAEYKMWGNGVALPCARVPLHGMAQRGAKTLGSLFDGSGGFPLAAHLDGIETLWTSEIEPYCIAVTRERFNGTTCAEAQN